MFSFTQSCTVVRSLFSIKFVPVAVIRMALAISLALGISGCHTLPANCFSNPPHADLVVFGDSYSDTGNRMVNLLPPFHGARICNGPLAVEHLATHLNTTALPSFHTFGCKVGYNYASLAGEIRGAKDEDLLCQVNAYLERTSNNASTSALYFVMMGGNDVRKLDVSLSDTDRDIELNAILDVLFEQLQRLVNAGVMKLMVANSGDMGKLPSSIESGAATSNTLTVFSQRYNVLFDARMTTLTNNSLTANPLIKIVTFDLFGAMTDILATGPFVDKTHGCYDVGPPQKYHSSCSSTAIDTFVFFDEVHATAKTNELIWGKIKLVMP